MNDVAKAPSPHRLAGAEHWTTKEGNVKLFLWNKCDGDPANTKGIVLFVHGSSMASQPTFDLDVPGRPDSSAMAARPGRYSTTCSLRSLIRSPGFMKRTSMPPFSFPWSKACIGCPRSSIT